MEKSNYVLTIGRQLGSGGKRIGEHLSQHLNIPCYDKELIRIASQESGLGKEFFEKADEQSSHSFFATYFGFRSGYMGSISGNYLCNETLFQIQSDVIKELAEKESGIFVGRCADYILREHPRRLAIFVTASIEDRVQRVLQDKNLSEKDARMLIEQTDKRRAEYYNYYSNKEWGKATSYDLCINSSVFGIDAAVSLIEECIRKKACSDWR
ncbi:MAG: cytidylate kinase-like family protein [Dysgonamonadaceae bacterium]|jgi:cytidylate kinase|nr:cytidylate kinase-like family protein [Dysgonamonadaceae bacterium]